VGACFQLHNPKLAIRPNLSQHPRRQILAGGTSSFIIAKSEFEKFLHERLSQSALELSQATGSKGIAKELHNYISNYSGKRLQVRMQGGHLQPHRAFHIEEDPNGRLASELPMPGDELLPVFSLEDFRVLDGLSQDFREKADDLGLPWDHAFTILKRFSTEAGRDATVSTATEQLKNSNLASSFPELLRKRSP
jgi:hypothetical protein